jgi:hypothetical protein
MADIVARGHTTKDDDFGTRSEDIPLVVSEKSEQSVIKQLEVACTCQLYCTG